MTETLYKLSKILYTYNKFEQNIFCGSLFAKSLEEEYTDNINTDLLLKESAQISINRKRDFSYEKCC